MPAILSLFILSLEFSGRPVDFHAGYHLSVQKTIETDTGNHLREKFFVLGASMPFSVPKNEHLFGEALISPEVVLGQRLLGFNLLFGPEYPFDIGPYANPIFLVFRTQAGVHYSYLWDTKGRPASVRSEGDELVGIDFDVFSRNNFGVMGHFSVGYRFSLAKRYWFEVQLNTRLLLGYMAPNSLRSTTFKRLGWTSGINLEIDF